MKHFFDVAEVDTLRWHEMWLLNPGLYCVMYRVCGDSHLSHNRYVLQLLQNLPPTLTFIYDKRERERYRKFYLSDPKRKDNLGDLDTDRKILLIIIYLEKIGYEVVDWRLLA